jgi:glycine cleavage system H protein
VPAGMDEMGCTRRALRGPQTHLRYHPGHTWIHLQSADLVVVGATDFAVSFLGTPATISLPTEPRSLMQGDVAWTLVSANGRRLRQVTPVPGKVVAVNTDLLRDPGLLQQSPYDRAWILCIKPRDTSASMRDLLSYEAYLRNLDRVRSTLSAHLDPVVRLAWQNGAWRTAFGDRLSVTEWKAWRNELFPVSVLDRQLESSHLRVG